jgi:hypothetical protein
VQSGQGAARAQETSMACSGSKRARAWQESERALAAKGGRKLTQTMHNMPRLLLVATDATKGSISAIDQRTRDVP